MPTHDTELHELDRRTNDGIDVRLLWRAADNQPLVAVEDARTGASFTIAVRRDMRAYDVFHHPYAYAGERDADPSVPDLEEAPR